MGEFWNHMNILCTMDARMVFPLLLLAAAAVAPLSSGQLADGFYKTSCPDAEKIIFGIVEKRFKEDPGIAGGLLRLAFHDCFANGCDASILIDPLSNQASEKEAGPNISVNGYDIIDEIKTELEKKCPEVVSCADIVVTSARDAVRLTGGPAYKVPTGRRDALESKREDADNLPGPDIAVPKLIGDFEAQGFNLEEMVALVAGGHTIGSCKCFFIEIDAAPIDPDYQKNISKACEGTNRDRGSVPMDMDTPNVFDSTYFALALAKKMPLTVDRLLGMDPKTEPILKSMGEKPETFVPLFAKAMEKVGALKVLTGKDGEIRKACGEVNNPKPTNDGPSVIRVSSLNPDHMGLSGPGGAAKAGGQAAAVNTATPGAVGTAAAVNQAKPIQGPGNKVLGDEPRSKLPGGAVGTAAAVNQAKPIQGPGNGQGSMLPGDAATIKALNEAQATEGARKGLRPGQVPGSEDVVAKTARDEEFRKRNLEKLRRRQEAANKAAGGEEAKPKLRGGQI